MNSLGVVLSPGGSAGAERSEGERSEPQRSAATGEAGAAPGSSWRPDSEVVAKPKRRTFSTEYKIRMLAEADAASATPGGAGALLRREGLYSSHLVSWRRERRQGMQEALLVGQWRQDLAGLERKLQQELDEGPQIPSFQKSSKRSRTTMA